MGVYVCISVCIGVYYYKNIKINNRKHLFYWLFEGKLYISYFVFLKWKFQETHRTHRSMEPTKKMFLMRLPYWICIDTDFKIHSKFILLLNAFFYYILWWSDTKYIKKIIKIKKATVLWKNWEWEPCALVRKL